MPESQIIRDVVEDLVPLEKSLYRLIVLAKDVHNIRLEMWAQRELQGYASKDELPDYRKTHSFEFIYSGINGRLQVTNVPLTTNWIRKEVLDVVSEVYIRDGIKYVNELANADGEPKIDVTALAGEVYKTSGGMISCTSISQIVPRTLHLSILAEVKTKLITALCELEKKYGCLDNLGIKVTKIKSVQIDANNEVMNKAVFNISVSESEKKKDKWYSKVAWNIIVPIITGLVGVILEKIIGF